MSDSLGISSGRCMEPASKLRREDGVKRCAGTAPKGNAEGLHGCVIGSKDGLEGGLLGRRLSEESEVIIKGHENSIMLLIVLTPQGNERSNKLSIACWFNDEGQKKASCRMLFQYFRLKSASIYAATVLRTSFSLIRADLPERSRK